MSRRIDELFESTEKQQNESNNQYFKRICPEGWKWQSVKSKYYEWLRSRGKNRYKDQGKGENSRYIAGYANDIDELIAILNIDLDIWEVKEWEVKSSSWEGAMKVETNVDQRKESTPYHYDNKQYYIKAKIIRKVSKGLEDVLERTKDIISEYVEPVKKIKYKGFEKCASVINIFDAHIDKLALTTETGENSDFNRNVELFQSFFDKLLAKEAVNKPERIYFPVGSDFFHTNDLGSATTKKGTPQDISVQPIVSFPIGVNAIRTCIDKASCIAPVTVVVIRGNHDDDKTFYLGYTLSIIYEKNPNVTIDDRRVSRKYYQYGRSILGFSHGNYEKRNINEFPNRMLMENKDILRDIDHCDMFLGDIHHKQEFKFMRVKDFPGVTMRFLRSISTTDKYHHDNGYLGIPKTAESFTYDFHKGLEGNNMVTIK